MSGRALKILLVNENCQELRHAARLLATFGYDIRSLSAFDQVQDTRVAWQPDVAVLSPGSKTDRALTACTAMETSASVDGHFTYTLLQVQDPQPAEVLRAIEAGVDDFLVTPLEDGELLSRLRMAARVIEYERRIGAPNNCGRSAGLLSLPALRNHVQAELRRLQPDQTVSCISIEIDGHDELQTMYGKGAMTRLVAGVAAQVVGDLPASSKAAVDEDHFVVSMTVSTQEAHRWAEQLRQRIVAIEFPLSETRSGVTVSCGISGTDDREAAADDVITEAELSLKLAQRSGGNHVATYDEYCAEEDHWSEIAAAGTVFENTIAKNIMVPCTLLLKETDSVAQVEVWLKQTQLRALPVIDDEGKLAGLVTASQLASIGKTSREQPVSAVMSKEVVSFDERTTLAALIDYFAQESPLVIVIVNKGRPTGLVTPNSLATLIERLTTETFAVGAEAGGVAGLIVPNLCGVDC